MSPLLKVSLAILVVLLGAVFFYQPLKMVVSKGSITNDFLLQAADGPLDSKRLRGKVLAIEFGYANCGTPCAARMEKFAKAYELLSVAERAQVKMILVSVDPEHDTPARIRQYATGIGRDIVGATGTPENIQAVAEAFGADYKKFDTKDGGYAIDMRGLTYVVDAEGRFASVLNEMAPAEQIAAALRQRVPAAALPPR